MCKKILIPLDGSSQGEKKLPHIEEAADRFQTAVIVPVIICQTAEQENVDLIAMASHGRTAAARFFYGSVAAGVLNRIDRPLRMIRSKPNE